MKSIYTFLILLCGTAICFSFKTNGESGIAESDSTFLKRAASSGMMEVRLGQMAQQKAQSADVKAFGATMVSDHTKANAALKSLAQSLNIAIPDTLARKHQRHVEHLSSMSGAAFDRYYMRMMTDAHQDDIDEFEDASKKATAASVRDFAAKQLPLLKAHREAAQQLRSKLRPAGAAQ